MNSSRLFSCAALASILDPQSSSPAKKFHYEAKKNISRLCVNRYTCFKTYFFVMLQSGWLYIGIKYFTRKRSYISNDVGKKLFYSFGYKYFEKSRPKKNPIEFNDFL